MPYVAEDERESVQFYGPRTPGQLNYAITSLIMDYLRTAHEGAASYAAYNSIIGVLECAKLEMYRRLVAPYETQKHALNGDVYVT